MNQGTGSLNASFSTVATGNFNDTRPRHSQKATCRQQSNPFRSVNLLLKCCGGTCRQQSIVVLVETTLRCETRCPWHERGATYRDGKLLKRAAGG